MKKEILRIIDANINRATEGLRVVEDILRYNFNDKKIYFSLRDVRHKIVKIFSNFYPETVFCRDSKKDPGKKAKEKKYSLTNEILVSNLHRVTESFRVLEEISKLIDIKNVLKIKKLRYKIYDLEKDILRKFM